MKDDDAYSPYCKICGGYIHRGRGGSWVHYKLETYPHKAEPIWTSAGAA